jgi:hypothetical protein
MPIQHEATPNVGCVKPSGIPEKRSVMHRRILVNDALAQRNASYW